MAQQLFALVIDRSEDQAPRSELPDRGRAGKEDRGRVVEGRHGHGVRDDPQPCPEPQQATECGRRRSGSGLAQCGPARFAVEGAARSGRTVCLTDLPSTMIGSALKLAFLGKSPVHGGTDCIVSFRIERVPHVVGEYDISPRIRAELKLKSPADRDERVPSTVYHSEGTCDSISQGLGWIGRRPSRTDPDTHSPTGEPPTWPRTNETRCQHRPDPERNPPLCGTRDDHNSAQLGVVAGVTESGDSAERRAHQDRRNAPSHCPRYCRLDIQVLQMSQRVGARRSSVATGVVGQNLESVFLETPSQCLNVRMILARRQSVYEHNGGRGRVIRRWPVETCQGNAIGCDKADWPRCSVQDRLQDALHSGVERSECRSADHDLGWNVTKRAIPTWDSNSTLGESADSSIGSRSRPTEEAPSNRANP